MQRTFIDTSRPIKPAFDFPGTPDRRIDVRVWYPAVGGEAGLSPLVVYSHGTGGFPGNAMYLVDQLVRHGYMVVAPVYPLTSCESFTGISKSLVKDVINQPADISFVIDQILADEQLGKLVDAERIGLAGHSLGALTGYLTCCSPHTRDERIGANAMMGVGDPVEAALRHDLGFDSAMDLQPSTPSLFLSAQHDVFANLLGEPFVAYSRLPPPKQEILIAGGNHTWFRDGGETHPEGLNPDCLHFEKSSPGRRVPGCLAPVDLIEPKVQREISGVALLYFFEAYLKGEAEALDALRNLDRRYPQIQLHFED